MATDAQGETAPQETAFAEFKSHLLKGYQKWELPHIFIRRIEAGQRVSMQELAILARDTFLHDRSGIDKDDPEFSVESFKHDSLHAISALQRRCVELYKEKLNPRGFVLLIDDHDDAAQWQEDRGGINRHLSEVAEISSPRSRTRKCR